MYLVVVTEAEIVGGTPREVGDLKKDDQATKDCVRKSQRLILLHRYVTRQGTEDRSEERDAGASGALEKLVGYPSDYPWCLYKLFFSCRLQIVAGFIYVPVRLRKGRFPIP